MREYTSKLIAMMDEGIISAEAVAEMALAYMSEDDVKDMCLANDLLIGEAYEEADDENIEIDLDGGVSAVNEQEDWTPDNADFNDPGSRHHY
jgi:hypothetical protein